MLIKLLWQSIWLATQRYARCDWAMLNFPINYDVCTHPLFVNPFTATGYFDIPPPRWPTFLVTLFPILKEGMGLSLLDECEVQYHVIKM